MEEDRAAATIAAAKRGKNARKQAAERKEQSKASSTIAAARKGKNARKERKEMSDGAVRIQSQYRGRQSRARCAETGADQAQRYYTPAEVAKHDRADDLRVSLFGKVLDLSELVRANRGLLVQPLIAAAGTDITHWFDDSTHDPCTYIDPETEIEVPFTPMGRFLHCVPAEPDAAWASDVETPWWKDDSYVLGRLTAKTRRIKLLNMLSRQETTLEVCFEETLNEIQRRYMAFNAHAQSYTWKRTDSKQVGRVLDMRKTLDENGVKDDTPEFDQLNIDEDFYTPVLHLYFSDDLTIA
jgi:cytochrome b involved in lipid metabolism